MAAPGDVGTFHAWDYVVIATVLIISSCIGLFYAFVGGKQRTSKEFLLADRNMNPVPVSISLVASFISAVTVLGTPAEIYRNGTMYWLICVAVILTGIITSRTFLPIFYEYEISSTNEYLERRFNRKVRYVGTFLFFLNTLLYLGIVIYAPALALNAVTGLNLWGSVAAIGVVCTFYTTIGGLKAVLWTDVFQVCIMLAGLLAVLIEGSMRLGGLTEAWRIADERDRIDFWNFNPNPTIRHTFWSLAIGGAFQWTATYGTNQTQIQRYLSCGKKSTALWSLGLAICGMVVMLSIVCLVGIVMFAFYADCDPYTMGYVSASDQLLPYFIMELFGDRPGLPGLCTACIFSAALSTVSSGINALTTITGEDIIKSIWPNIPEATYTIIIKVTACCFGIIAMLLSYLASQSDAILQATISVFGLVGGPLLGLFSLGVFFPCVNSYGAAFGPLISLGFSFWVGVGAIIYPPDSNSPSLSTELCVEGNTTQYISTLAPSIIDDPYPKIASFYGLSYMWYGGFSWCICIIFGLLISFATRHNDPKETDVTLHRPIVDAFLCCFPPKCTDVCRCGVGESETIREEDKFKEHLRNGTYDVTVAGLSFRSVEANNTSM